MSTTTDVVKARPLTLYPWEVRGLLAGRVSQLRRPVNPQPADPTAILLAFTDGYRWATEDRYFRDPLGGVGARAWVREAYSIRRTFRYDPAAQTYIPVPGPGETLYRADHAPGPDDDPVNWQAAVTMPRGLARLTLEITAVRPERPRQITDADAIACGARHFPDLPLDRAHRNPSTAERWSMGDPEPTDTGQCLSTPRVAWGNWWNRTYGDKSGNWDEGWLWVREVRVIPDP